MTSKTNHTSLIQRTDYLLATAMLIVSILLLFASSWVIGSPKTVEESLLSRASSLSQQQCNNALTQYNVSFSKIANNGFEVKEPSTRPLSALMERTTLIQQACPGFEVETLCAGEGCADSQGLNLTLTQALPRPIN